MASRVVTAERYALAERISVPFPDSRWKRRNASWTMSSASLALPTIRYAMEDIRGLRSSYTWLTSASRGTPIAIMTVRRDSLPACDTARLSLPPGGRHTGRPRPSLHVDPMGVGDKEAVRSRTGARIIQPMSSVTPSGLKGREADGKEEGAMRKLIVNEFLSLDGVMQAPGDPDEDRSGGFAHGGWQPQDFDEDFAQVAFQGLAHTDAYLFGRRTYEIMAAFWPTQPDDVPFAGSLNGLPKYVASTTLSEPLEWRNSTLLQGDVAKAVAELKEEPGKNVVVLGSGDLVQTLMENDLVDEYGLMINPILLGGGKRLFREGSPKRPLRLVRSMTTSTGVIVATYEPDRS